MVNNHLNNAVIHYNIGDVLSRRGELSAALVSHQKALEIRQVLLGDDHFAVGQSHNSVGSVLKNQSRFNEALYHYERDLAVRKINRGPEHFSVAQAYNNLGLIWRAAGEFDRALTYFKNSIDIKTRSVGEGHQSIGESKFNIALVLMQQHKEEEALVYFKQCRDTFLKLFGEQHPYIAIVLSVMSNAYRNIGEKEQALPLAKKALQIAKQVYSQSPNHLRLGEAYYEVGGVYIEFEQYQLALNYMEKALVIRKIRQGNSPNVAGNLIDIGGIKMALGLYDETRSYLDRAFKTLSYDPTLPQTFKTVIDPLMLKKSFNLLGTYYKTRHKKEQDPIFQDSLIQLHHIHLALEDFLQLEYSNQSTRRFYAQEALPIFEEAIEYQLLSNTQSGLNQAFAWSEKTKARQLTEKVELEAREIHFGVPQLLLKQANDLDSVIYEMEHRQTEALHTSDQNELDSTVMGYRQQLFKFYEQRDTLIKTIKQNHPDYYKLRYSRQLINIAGIQDSLLQSEKDAFLQYFVGDSSLFAFLILKDTALVRTTRLSIPLDRQVASFRCSLLDGSNASDGMKCADRSTESARAQYTRVAHELYLKLIAPIAAHIPVDAHLTIVPDGVLGYLPFEALLVQPADDSQNFYSYDYLLHHYAISYGYSATLQREMCYRQHGPRKLSGVLGVAPIFDDSLYQATISGSLLEPASRYFSLEPLTYNGQEIKAISRHFSGKWLIGKSANKHRFLEEAPQYPILHLSTHAVADDRIGDHSFLVFSQEQSNETLFQLLFNRELYNLKLQTDMVVLSACETGIGELRRGEGIISLARGFSYAGAKSIITSLWHVNDKNTAILMNSFYKNLKKGKSKDVALREAKQAYLKVPDDDIFRSPLFWAAFIPIGDMAPIEDSQPFPSRWWLLVLLPLGYFWFKFRRQSS